MNKLTKYILLVLTIFILACGTKRTPDSCNGAICTTEFRMMTIRLVDSNGNVFVPDKVETYQIDSTLIHSETNAAIPAQNRFTIVDDGDLNELGVNVENDVVFKVIKNAQVVKQQSFKVKADCCHIIPISTDTVLLVN